MLQLISVGRHHCPSASQYDYRNGSQECWAVWPHRCEQIAAGSPPNEYTHSPSRGSDFIPQGLDFLLDLWGQTEVTLGKRTRRAVTGCFVASLLLVWTTPNGVTHPLVPSSALIYMHSIQCQGIGKNGTRLPLITNPLQKFFRHLFHQLSEHLVWKERKLRS